MSEATSSPRAGTSIDDEVVATRLATVSVLDRGFLYGDSVFETLRTHGGNALFLSNHLQRLEESLQRLHFQYSLETQDVRRAIGRLQEKFSPGCDVVVRITVTRGDRIDGSHAPAGCQPRLVIMATEIEEDGPPAPLSLMVAKQLKPSPQVLDPRVKCGNYLPSIIARDEALRSGCDEAVLLDGDGIVTETTAANLFWVEDSTVFTCGEDRVLAGITRRSVIDLLEAVDIEVVEGAFPLSHLLSAREAFITASLRGVTAVQSIDGRELSSLDDRSVTARVQEIYRDHLLERVERSHR